MPTSLPTPFALDPTLPWLSSDPAMQEPAAFQDMRTVTLNDQTWEPMGRYFPGGTQLAMRRVTSLDQLTEGAAYWSEMSYYEASRKEIVTYYHLGRYAGLAYPESKSTPRRWKKGEAHLTLESDVLDCDLRSYFLHDDGTKTCFVDVNGYAHKLYQLTHYVSLPAPLLAELGVEAIKQAGLTLRQACWLKQEQELTGKAVELTAQTSWEGLAAPECRVVLPTEQAADFFTLQEGIPQLTPGQAKRRKAGALAITYRRRNPDTGRSYTCTEYYALEDAPLLYEWLRTHSTAQRAHLDAAVQQQVVHQAAEVARAQRAAEQQEREAAQALALAQQARLALQQGLPLTPHTYAGLDELVLAA